MKEENGITLDAQTIELYNLEQDAAEQNNLAPSEPELVRRLQILALQYTDYIIPPRFMGLQTTQRVNICTDNHIHGLLMQKGKSRFFYLKIVLKFVSCGSHLYLCVVIYPGCRLECC